ncbi:MAG: hypothetical protein H6576_15865 [Lewinellaceae bacterium]|nr:hypothetical protein [Saprospiraceae bacterium]MCB9345166.1 hypothetical protein [Lewinellaceae bacterium]
MKTRLLFVIMWIALGHASAQVAFDPNIDSIAVMHPNGIWEILISEKLLIKSAQKVVPRLTEVSELSVQQIHSKPYLFFRGKDGESPESGFTLMVALKEKAPNLWMAGNKFQICRGVYCSVCGFDEYWGCACERYDGVFDADIHTYCRHSIALGMGLAPVSHEK